MAIGPLIQVLSLRCSNKKLLAYGTRHAWRDLDGKAGSTSLRPLEADKKQPSSCESHGRVTAFVRTLNEFVPKTNAKACLQMPHLGQYALGKRRWSQSPIPQCDRRLHGGSDIIMFWKQNSSHFYVARSGTLILIVLLSITLKRWVQSKAV